MDGRLNCLLDSLLQGRNYSSILKGHAYVLYIHQFSLQKLNRGFKNTVHSCMGGNTILNL